MPTINEFTINGAAINGGDSLSLPATVEEICFAAEAAFEVSDYSLPAAAWELPIPDLIQAVWELKLSAAIEEC